MTTPAIIGISAGFSAMDSVYTLRMKIAGASRPDPGSPDPEKP
jgi:hypothetical protein